MLKSMLFSITTKIPTINFYNSSSKLLKTFPYLQTTYKLFYKRCKRKLLTTICLKKFSVKAITCFYGVLFRNYFPVNIFICGLRKIHIIIVIQCNKNICTPFEIHNIQKNKY